MGSTPSHPMTELEAQYGLPPRLESRRESAPQLSPIALSLTHSTRTIFSQTAHSSLSAFGHEVQLRPVFRIAIQQLSMGFSNSRPSQSDENIGINLGGVSNPNVVSPHNDILSTVYDSRAMYFKQSEECRVICVADFGIDGQINFTRSIQGSTTPPTSTTITTENKAVPNSSVSFPANTYLASPFIEMQASKIDFWKPLIFRPALVTANVASLMSYLTSKKVPNQPPGTASIDFVLNQDRSFSLGENIGTRQRRKKVPSDIYARG
jgi:hypothetical protein